MTAATAVIEKPPLEPADYYRVFNADHAGTQTTVALVGDRLVRCYVDLEGLLRQLKIERGRTVGDPQIDPEVAAIFHGAGWTVTAYHDNDPTPDDETIPIYGDDPFATEHRPERGGQDRGIDRYSPQIEDQAARIGVLETQNRLLQAKLDRLLAEIASWREAEKERDESGTTVLPAVVGRAPDQVPPAPTVEEVTGRPAKRRPGQVLSKDELQEGAAPKLDALAGIPEASRQR